MENSVESVKNPFLEIKYVGLRPGTVVPSCQTPGSAGLDLAACLEEPLDILPGEVRMVPLGFAAEIPPGCAGFVFSRSGLGSKRGIVVAQGVGVIDSDYRGEWMVPLRNLSGEPYRLAHGERIAQVVILPVMAAAFTEVKSLSDSQRGQGGFGSTGAG